MKRLTSVCLWVLLSLVLATTAVASPRTTGDHARGRVPDAAIDRADSRLDSPAVHPSPAAEPAAKASPSPREVRTEQEIGDGHCFEYIIFEYWHVWSGCGTGGGGGGGW